MIKHLILALVLVATSAGAQSLDDVYLGMPSAGGSGCPAGTVSATLSPDASSLSILFDQFTAEAGRTTRRSVDRKSCNLAIPVHVPQGYSVSVIQVDYRGFNSLPQGGRSQFNVEYFFAGGSGPRYSRTFYGPMGDDYSINNTLVATAMVWSPCGASPNLRVNASMTAYANRSMEQTLATVDSADINAGLVYHLQWRRCN